MNSILLVLYQRQFSLIPIMSSKNIDERQPGFERVLITETSSQTFILPT